MWRGGRVEREGEESCGGEGDLRERERREMREGELRGIIEEGENERWERER